MQRQPRAGARGDRRGRAKLSYPALTAYCRRTASGTIRHAVGQYHFDPAEEAQTTLAARPIIGGKKRGLRPPRWRSVTRGCSLQLYPRFTRFECKVF